MQTAQVSPAVASELDVLTTPTPTTGFVLDDARILSKSALGELNSLAANIEKDTVSHASSLVLAHIDANAARRRATAWLL